ncbi:MAG: hypothetical protein IPN18_13700 [Ignavibacteriales bacterium]|nr:hypothetical protein [Ignavibacteriales bacterium]
MELNETFQEGNNNAVLIPVDMILTVNLKNIFYLRIYHTTNSHVEVLKSILNQQPFNHIFSKGVIVYHINDENFDYPTMTKIDMECADGKWDWQVIQGGSTRWTDWTI